MKFTQHHGLTNDELLLMVYNKKDGPEHDLELELALRLEEMMDEFGPPEREASGCVAAVVDAVDVEDLAV